MRPFVENFPFFCIFLALVAGILSATFRSGRAAYRMTLAVTGAIAVLSALTLRYVVEGGLSFGYTMGRFPIPLGNAIRCGPLQGLLPQQFRIGEHRGQGCFQVVGHVGDQLYLHPFAAGLLCQGPVQARLDVVQLLRRLPEVPIRR